MLQPFLVLRLANMFKALLKTTSPAIYQLSLLNTLIILQENYTIKIDFWGAVDNNKAG
jgi:hypothetical protein